MELDIFNRQNLLGNQDIDTSINNFNDYLESLLNPFNNIITTSILDLKQMESSIPKPITFNSNMINDLIVKNTTIIDKFNYINKSAQLLTIANTYKTELDTTKQNFTTIFNGKATYNSILTRPTVNTVLDLPNSIVNKEYVMNRLLSYILPTPIPNTTLYVNRSGTELIWA